MLEAALTLFSAAFSLYVCKNMGANKIKKRTRKSERSGSGASMKETHETNLKFSKGKKKKLQWP